MSHPPTRLERDLGALGSDVFDLLVVGGGVLGACVARDAARRGLRTALIEGEDFAAGTSWNSLKIIHGGLRYLQQLDLARMRESIRERSAWLRIAPHLVAPLPVVVPTHRYRIRSRAAMRAALLVNDAVSWDRNRELPPDRRIPPGRGLSRREVLELVPEFDRPGLSGGVLFHDGQVYSTERLVLAVITDAAGAGATVANHVGLTGPARRRDGLLTVVVEDRVTGGPFDVRARYVVNAAGAATDAVASALLGRPVAPASPPSVGVNVLLRRSLGHPVAFAVRAVGTGRGRDRPRELFVTPWRGQSAIGTGHYPCPTDPAAFQPAEEMVDRFLAEINAALPSAAVTTSDVAVVHRGILPARPTRDEGRVDLRRHPLVHDHAADGCPEVVTALSVKYTTARSAAERVVDLLFRKSGHRPPRCTTAVARLPGAPSEPFDDVLRRFAAAAPPSVPSDVAEHLTHSYGTNAGHIAALIRSTPGLGARVVPAAPVVHAQLAYARDFEMAVTVDDLLARRTELGPRGLADGAAREVARETLSG